MESIKRRLGVGAFSKIRVTFGPEANIQRLRELFFNLRSNKLFHFVLLHAGKIIAHFTVTGGNEAGVDLVLIQPLLLYYVALMLTSVFKPNLH